MDDATDARRMRQVAALREGELACLAALTAYADGDEDTAWQLLRDSADASPRMTALGLLGLLHEAMRRSARIENEPVSDVVAAFCLDRARDQDR